MLSRKEEFGLRIYAASVLEKVKSEKSEQLMVKLFPNENYIAIKTALAYGLCKHFSKEAIPKVLTLLRYRYDQTMVDLKEAIYVNHVINNLQHKDLEKWRKHLFEKEQEKKEAMSKFEEGHIDIEQIQKNIKNFINKWNQ